MDFSWRIYLVLTPVYLFSHLFNIRVESKMLLGNRLKLEILHTNESTCHFCSFFFNCLSLEIKLNFIFGLLISWPHFIYFDLIIYLDLLIYLQFLYVNLIFINCNITELLWYQPSFDQLWYQKFLDHFDIIPINIPWDNSYWYNLISSSFYYFLISTILL